MEAHFKDLTSDIIGDVAFGYKFGNTESSEQTEAQLALRSQIENKELSLNTLILLRPLMPLIMLLPFGPGAKKRERKRVIQKVLTEVNMKIF